MKSKQVLSVEQMKHLEEIGLDTSDVSVYWVRKSHGTRIDDDSKGKWFLSLQKEFITCGFTLMKYFLLILCKILFTICLASSAIKC